MAGSGEVPALIEDRLRAVCQGLPGAYEEPAWTGIRWRVRGRTFAHACTVNADNPVSHARVFATNGPVSVLTFRAPADEVGGLIGSGFPFYWPGWGDNVVGMVLDKQTDWTEVAELLLDSFRIQAPKKLAGRANLSSAFDQVGNDAEETVITRSGHESMVLLPLREYEAMKETLYLLKGENGRILRERIADMDARQNTTERGQIDDDGHAGK